MHENFKLHLKKLQFITVLNYGDIINYTITIHLKIFLEQSNNCILHFFLL